MFKATVVGLGYVGLPLAKEMVAAGIRVVGYDRSETVTENLRNGLSHVDDIPDSAVSEMIKEGFLPTSDVSAVNASDVVIICVPTPLAVSGEPDLGAVLDATETVATRVARGALVVLESTTFPGTTDEILKPILEKSGHKVGEDIFLAFSPERVDPGNTKFGIRNTPKVVGGVTERCTEIAAKFYGEFVDDVVIAKGAREAETAKLLENTFRHINIALVNELAKVCDRMGIDVWDVIRCASTKPFGFQAFYPGPGVGGHCIPIDPNYLNHAVRTALGHPLRFVELAQEINASMPAYVSRRAAELLNRSRLPLNGSRVLLVGVTYKENIGDQRESPATPLARELWRAGAELFYYDPYVAGWSVDGDSVQEWPPSEGDAGERADLTIVLQHHDAISANWIYENSVRVLDTRGKLLGSSVEYL